MTEQQLREAFASFAFEYVGGGYFRTKGIPKGISAPMLHGETIIKALLDHIIQAVPSEI